MLTISKEPLRTPHSMFEYHSSFWARPSSGNSTKSPSGFSSNTKENCLLSLVQFVTVGVMLRKILKPTYCYQPYPLIGPHVSQNVLSQSSRRFPGSSHSAVGLSLQG